MYYDIIPLKLIIHSCNIFIESLIGLAFLSSTMSQELKKYSQQLGNYLEKNKYLL